MFTLSSIFPHLLHLNKRLSTPFLITSLKFHLEDSIFLVNPSTSFVIALLHLSCVLIRNFSLNIFTLFQHPSLLANYKINCHYVI